jgi:hypothetical protein
MPPTGGFTLLCSLYSHIMYQVQFWFGGNVQEWRGCGEPLFKTEDAARTRIRALREQSHGYVSFRVEPVYAP